MRVNIVSNIDEKVWKSLEHYFYASGSCNFVYSSTPIIADVHIFFGITPDARNLQIESKSIFILTEPPEILKYRETFLNLFSAVYGPDFDYLASNSRTISGPPLLPLHIGMTFQGGKTRLKSTLNELSHLETDKVRIVTAFASNKLVTPLQRNRHIFLQSLKSKLGKDLQIFGRGIAEVEDKWEVLSRSTHHIALENSIHNHYWTEKLADSIFAKNYTYYLGAPNIDMYFDTKTIMKLDVLNPEECALKVAEHFYSDSIDSNSLNQNFITLRDSYNIFRFSETFTQSISFEQIESKSLKIKFHKTFNHRNILVQRLYAIKFFLFFRRAAKVGRNGGIP